MSEKQKWLPLKEKTTKTRTYSLFNLIDKDSIHVERKAIINTHLISIHDNTSY